MKKIILGVSSSIAAYKAYDITRLLTNSGYSVFNVLTEKSLNLVAPLTFEILSGNPVYTDLFTKERRAMGHIELKEDAALMIVAPATANIIGKFANGIADDLLSTTYLSVICPVIIAPAMNPNMYNHPALQENIKKLKSRGVQFVEPGKGKVACGDEGYGRLAGTDKIFKAAKDVLEK